MSQREKQISVKPKQVCYETNMRQNRIQKNRQSLRAVPSRTMCDIDATSRYRTVSRLHQWFPSFLVLRPLSKIPHKRSAPAIAYSSNCWYVQFNSQISRIQQTFVTAVRDPPVEPLVYTAVILSLARQFSSKSRSSFEVRLWNFQPESQRWSFRLVTWGTSSQFRGPPARSCVKV